MYRKGARCPSPGARCGHGMSLGCPTLDAAQSAEILAKSLRNTRETSEQDGSRKCVTGEAAARLMRSEGGTEGAPLRDPRELHGTFD